MPYLSVVGRFIQLIFELNTVVSFDLKSGWGPKSSKEKYWAWWFVRTRAVFSFWMSNELARTEIAINTRVNLWGHQILSSCQWESYMYIALDEVWELTVGCPKMGRQPEFTKCYIPSLPCQPVSNLWMIKGPRPVGCVAGWQVSLYIRYIGC